MKKPKVTIPTADLRHPDTLPNDSIEVSIAGTQNGFVLEWETNPHGRTSKCVAQTKEELFSHLESLLFKKRRRIVTTVYGS